MQRLAAGGDLVAYAREALRLSKGDWLQGLDCGCAWCTATWESQEKCERDPPGDSWNSDIPLYTWDRERCRWCGKWREPLLEKVWLATRVSSVGTAVPRNTHKEE